MGRNEVEYFDYLLGWAGQPLIDRRQAVSPSAATAPTTRYRAARLSRQA